MTARTAPARRDSYLTVRLNDAERNHLNANAIVLDVTASDYVRSLISLPLVVAERAIKDAARFDETGEHAMFVVYDRHSVNALIKQVRAWGYHMNQAVHALNIIASRKYMSAEDTAELVGKAVDLLSDFDDYRKKMDETAAAIASSELVSLGR